MKNLQFSLIALLLSVIIIVSGCKKKEEDKYFSSTNSISISGKVYNQDNEVIPGVTVKINDKSAITDSEGVYKLNNIGTANTKLTIQFTKDGYISITRNEIVSQSLDINVSMISLSSNLVSQTTFSSQQGTTISTSDGSFVNLPANNFQDVNGNDYNGVIKVQAIYINPDNANFSQFIDQSSYLVNDYGQYLESYGVLRVELLDANGNEIIYQNDSMYKSGGASIGVTIPQSKISSAPQNITLYSYDNTKSAYVASGTASKNGGQYVGTVSHFSSWTCAEIGSAPSIGSAQYTINGGIYSNQTFSNFNYFSAGYTIDTSGVYNYTYISANGLDGYFDIYLVNIQSIGTYPIDGSYTYVSVAPPSASSMSLQSGTVNITRYDAVGGLIEGTFNGSVSDTSGTYNVSNGAFSVIRASDQ